MPRRRTVLLAIPAVAVALLEGCTGASVNAPTGRIHGIRRLCVVALGPVPMEVPSGMANALVAQLPKPSPSAARGVGVLSSILMLAELPDAQKRATLGGQAVTAELSAEGAWWPGLIVAREVATRLGAAGRSVLGPVDKAVPGTTAEAIVGDLGAYTAAMRAWWAEPESSVVYQADELQQVDAVLEVFIYYSAFFAGNLMLTVRLKVIDPVTRDMIARVVKYEYRDIGTPEAALANDAAVIKRVFGELSASLVPTSLAELGLLPR